MSTLYITEYQSIARGNVQVPQEPPLRKQTVTIGASSTQSAAFSQGCNLVRLHTDVICSKVVGLNPTATATDARMAANQTEYIGVIPGQIIAVITNT